MKYKIKSSMSKPPIEHLEMGKYDWVLWSGEYKDSCIQIGGLFRYVPCDRQHANCVDSNCNYLRSEQLTFQSRKAVLRWVRKHKQWVIVDYKERNGGKRPHWVMATQWRGKGCLYIHI